jgi:hypothetical protein
MKIAVEEEPLVPEDPTKHDRQLGSGIEIGDQIRKRTELIHEIKGVVESDVGDRDIAHAVTVVGKPDRVHRRRSCLDNRRTRPAVGASAHTRTRGPPSSVACLLPAPPS